MWFISFGTFREFLTTSSPKNTSVELRLNESKIYLSAKDDIYIQSHIQSQQRKQHDTYVWDKLKITVNTPQWFSFRTGWKKWKYSGLERSSLLPLSTVSYFFVLISIWSLSQLLCFGSTATFQYRYITEKDKCSIWSYSTFTV